MSKGRFTMPIEQGIDKELSELMALWGADAVRNSDGTQLSPALGKLVEKVYGTFFPVRQDQAYAEAHPDQLQQCYLLSKQNIAKSDVLEINVLDGFFAEQLRVNTDHDPQIWWEVIDRTTGEIVSDWTQKDGIVTVRNAKKYHAYTVTFLAWQTWDPTQMYNHITNNWGDAVAHSLPYNPAIPATYERMLFNYKNWLAENQDVNVVRFTTFFYHFTLYFNQFAKEKFVDWLGYNQSNSVEMLEGFAKEKGYRLRPEVLVDEGYYNLSFRIPSDAYREYMDYVQRFVARAAKALVDITHESGREAMMFLGDNFAGIEPYGPYFGSIGLDAVVGSVDGGMTLRMLADIPHVRYREGRFLPYFFPDTFHEGGKPTQELNKNWLQARRAILRSPIDRIGYGGYPSLAMQFPDFVQRVQEISDEFRTLYDNIGGTKPAASIKVAILNHWGKLRSWQCFMAAHSFIYKQTQIYMGILEALSGMPVDVTFLSFEEIKQAGIPADVQVVINAGAAYTAFSGGSAWVDPSVVETVRAWIDGGGGFIGVGEPTAYQHQGRFFQLADVLGVEKETGFTLGYTKYNEVDDPDHFILQGMGEIDLGDKVVDDIYRVSDTAKNLLLREKCTQIAANNYGTGRGVYLAGLPYSPQNTRLFFRAITWAASMDGGLNRWYAENINVECTVYPERGKFALANNTAEEQTTVFYLGDGRPTTVTLTPCELRWMDI